MLKKTILLPKSKELLSSMAYSRIYQLIFFLCLLPWGMQAQLAPHPSNIKWYQINTDKVQVIIPEGFEKQGRRVANLIHYMEENNHRSIGALSEKLSITLHNRTIIPNGFVGIAPFRSEFFATPPQSANFLGTVDWLDALSIHEYRHALQFANSKVGLTKLFYFLQGENGWGLLSGAAIPNWFWEGDATIMETAITKGGRGRAPFFTQQQRALLLNGINYSYQKARNGSFKDLVPNHYRLGYQLLMHGRAKYGNDFWKDIFESAARYKPLIYPYSGALKKQVGLTTTQLYREAYTQVTLKWQQQLEKISLSPTLPIPTKENRTVADYRFPFPQKDGSIICWKSSYDKTDALILITNGKEKVLTNIGFHIEKYLSVIGNKAVWTEYEQSPRRRNRNFSNIVLYDLRTNKKTRLTTEGRFFSPSFSYSEGRIVTVEITPNQKNTLLVLNAHTGMTLKKIPNPDNHFIAFPKWAENDTDIIYIAKKNSQLAIFKYNLINNDFTQLSDWTHHTIADLFIKGKAVYFTSSFSGIDNIYRIQLDQPKQIQQLTSVPIGAYYPALSETEKQLIFSEFTHLGYKLSALEFGKSTPQPRKVNYAEPHQQTFFSINQFNEEGEAILDKVPDNNFPVTRYKGLFKGLRLHSWNFYPSVSLPTLDVQIDNYLNDFSINLIGAYNLNENQPVYIASVSYGKLFPQLTGFVSSTSRNARFLNRQDSLQWQQFDQLSVGGQVSIPLTWLKDNFRTSFVPLGGYVQRYIRNVRFGDKVQKNNNFGNLQMGINFSILRRTALQNVGPKLGYEFNVLFQQSLATITDRQLRLNTKIFLPGIGINHNLRLGLAYQRERLRNEYQFSDSFGYPRGFGRLDNDAFLKLTADYQLPIAYPDWGFAGITYFKRIRLNTFFDYGRRTLEVEDIKDNHNSVGIEVIFDNNFWNELPVTFGIRNAYLLTRSDNNYQFGFFVRNFIIE